MADGFDAFIARMQQLLADEENSLFAQGDLTLAQRLDAEGMHKASELLNRSTSVLRERERISREFQPEGTAIPRVPGVAWTVYRELARIREADRRKGVWDQRPASEWTLASMRAAVAEALPATGSNRKTRTWHFEGYKLVVNVLDDSISIETTCPAAPIESVREEELDEHRRFVRYRKVRAGA